MLPPKRKTSPAVKHEENKPVAPPATESVSHADEIASSATESATSIDTGLDVSKMLGTYEEKPIVAVSDFATGAPAEKTASSFAGTPRPRRTREAARSYATSYTEASKAKKAMDATQPAVAATPASSSSSPEDRLKEDLKISYTASGVLDVTFGGYGFLRKDYAINPNADIYVSTSQIRRFWLRRGDEVEGLARPPKEGERFHSLLLIQKINGKELTEEESRTRKNFDDLTSLHPHKQLKLETDKDTLSTRITDLVAPIGFGQRALIVSQPKAGKTTFLKEIAMGITANHPEVKLMAILIGERPEEVTEIKRFLKGEVAASNFDESPRQQIKVANLALDRAKRMVEMGYDVVILLDSVTRLARALNLSTTGTGRSLSGGFDPSALYPAKKFLGAARNCEEGGSLTIIGTALVGTESRMDDLIYEELKGTGNMEIHLDREFANRRIFPAIDVEASGTRHEELLFTKERLNKINTLRRMLSLLNKEERIGVMIDKLMKTKDNSEFLDTLNANR